MQIFNLERETFSSDQKMMMAQRFNHPIEALKHYDFNLIEWRIILNIFHPERCNALQCSYVAIDDNEVALITQFDDQGLFDLRAFATLLWTYSSDARDDYLKILSLPLSVKEKIIQTLQDKKVVH
ncbi:hypothetical protein L0B53_19000 (plasmid) [Vibrio sp. SS-MA-C1-2]|uniref:hypothetical protein n=1 Tax=Vibrio sp. SS-MA-C1-2 TaxID=2908646 RepID=UPI001F190340|nr:hypothetical protein [Vibrio sp. SS-MA-C1-2]UJF20225.1 hypothetical protein L0B53_19000 [Vibrio sp. SS-MA-C1-2]